MLFIGYRKLSLPISYVVVDKSMRELMRFIKHPSGAYFCTNIAGNIILFILLFIANMLIASIFIYVAIWKIHVPEEILKNLANNQALFRDRFNFLSMFIIGGLLFPILEEIVFRLWLSFKRQHIRLSACALIVSYCLHIPNRLVIACLGIAFGCFGIFYTYKHKCQTFWDNSKIKHGNMVIYLSITVFTLMHILNYAPLFWQYSGYYMVLVFPVFIMAMLLSYIRLCMGFVYACMFHMLHNTLIFSYIAT
ncbi:MAG: CPBP family intramembrane metalloprotease [Prevotellaceae bacterium]|nr:CPBP family intramembrane metalloprotease [Prevotellaceae bacterium]